jgi:hypothetical protein
MNYFSTGNSNPLSLIAAGLYKAYSRIVKLSCQRNVKNSSTKESSYNLNKKRSPSYKYYYANNTDFAKLEWINLLNRSVFLVDNTELGKIEAVNQDSIVIKTGSLRAKRYYIIHNMLRRKKDAENYNNSHLFLDLVSDEITLYESSIIPNPNAFVTLGTSYKYIPLSFSQWKEQQERE